MGRLCYIWRVRKKHGSRALAHQVGHVCHSQGQEKDGPTMLREAMWAQDVDLTRLLVEYGADATMSDRNQLTPLGC